MCTSFSSRIFALVSETVAMEKKTFLLLMAQGQFNFGHQELESVAKICGVNLEGKWVGCKEFESNSDISPLCMLHSLPESNIRELMSRLVSCKAAYELWGSGTSYNTLKQSILDYPDSLKLPYFAKEKTFSIRLKGIKKRMSKSSQLEKIEELSAVLPFEGEVKLESPDDEFYIIEDHSVKLKQGEAQPAGIYFGRFLCEGQRHLMDRYSLKTRKFIGNTSMDPMLGFLMSNFACARPGTLVCDPFVGTGSLLISSAHYGSHVIGGDISYNILHGRGKSSRKGSGYRTRDETIKNSLLEYGLGRLFLDVLLTDAANHAWKMDGELFDAIITDPPYGIREQCTKIGSKKQGNIAIPDLAEGQIHFPEQKAYHLDDVFKDLLTFSASTLVKGGRLVYWLPVFRKDYTSDVIPKHPALKLVYNCEQILNAHSSRRLIVMEKFTDACDQTCASINSNVFAGHNAFRNKYFRQ